jgi:hypothetical protein
MIKSTYIKRRFRLFLSNSWPRWPRFLSLGLISPLIRRIIRALGRIALLIFGDVTLPSPKEGFFFDCGGGFPALCKKTKTYILLRNIGWAVAHCTPGVSFCAKARVTFRFGLCRITNMVR